MMSQWVTQNEYWNYE